MPRRGVTVMPAHRYSYVQAFAERRILAGRLKLYAIAVRRTCRAALAKPHHRMRRNP